MAKGKASQFIKSRRDAKQAQKLVPDESDSDSGNEGEDEEDELVCNVDSGDDYKDTMVGFIANLLASGRIKGDLMKLIFRSDENKEKDIAVLFDCRSVYLVGFEVNGQKLEFGKFGDDKVLGERSQQLGYGEQYSQFCDLPKVQVGHRPLKHAVKQISKFKGVEDPGYKNWLNEIKPGLATMIVMFSEGGRFTWVYEKLERLVTDEATTDTDVITFVADWMVDLFPFWSKVSRVVRDGGVGDADKKKPVPPLPARPREYNCQDVANAKKYQLWANDLVKIQNLDYRQAANK